MSLSFENPGYAPKKVWIFFFLFVLSNALLAYAPLSIVWQWVVGFTGLVFPALAGWFTIRPKARIRVKTAPAEKAWVIPLWLGVLLILGAVFLRFFQLTTLSLWPLTDEAKSGYYSLELAQQGLVHLLYDFSQLPPFYIWMQGWFFKVFGISLTSLWALPALLSVAAVGAAYFAARAHFSKNFALLFTLLMAFSFWPLYVGRFSHPGSLLLLWELLAWGFAGKVSRAADPKDQKRLGFFLGLWTGLGFYTFTSWPTVALVLTLWFFFTLRRYFLFFIVGAFLAYLPLGMAWLSQDYGGYIHHVWAFDPSQGWLPQIGRSLSDVSAFFWRSTIPFNLFAYKPFWGGYLDPVLGALFFIGVLIFCLKQPKVKIFAAFLALAIFYGPGFLTGGVEMFRILPILPFLLGGAVWGLLALLGTLKPAMRLPVLGSILLLSLSLDGYHLFGVYHGLWTQPKDNWFASKSAERSRAFQLLEDRKNQEGPGFVLTELVPDLYDQSLTLADAAFNAELNRGLDPARVKWAALLTNIHYQPYLAGLFPEGKWYWIGRGLDRPDGGLVLGFFPLPSSRPETLDRWINADRASHGLVPLVFDFRDYKSRKPVLGRLQGLYPLFQGDRFLESCFWEKVAENDYGDRDLEAQIEALKAAVEKGIPAAHLYNDLGALFLRRSRFREAEENFQKALDSSPNFTSAEEGLKAALAAEKTGVLPRD